MSINRIHIDIFKALLEAETYITMEDILNKSSIKITPRSFQNEMKKLIEVKNVIRISTLILPSSCR